MYPDSRAGRRCIKFLPAGSRSVVQRISFAPSSFPGNSAGCILFRGYNDPDNADIDKTSRDEQEIELHRVPGTFSPAEARSWGGLGIPLAMNFARVFAIFSRAAAIPKR